MPFCYAPWSNIDISPQGGITPCCKFRPEKYNEAPKNINTSTFDEYKNSRVLKIVQEDFEAGLWPAGCERCRIEEENGILSKRQLDYERWNEQYQSYDRSGWLTASLAFGNTCNLSCITCGPGSSSRWQQEHQARYNIDIRPNHFYKQGFVDEFLKNAPGLLHLDIPGGEPFLSGVREQIELLHRLIESGRSQDISIHYTTNVTIFPDERWWELWKNFKEIDMQLSIDGVGTHNEYIRFPSQWDDVSRHISLYQEKQQALTNFRLSISHTVSAYNIFYVPDFFVWCQKQGLPRPWLGRVHTPIHMRPSVWKNEAKSHIVDRLKNSDNSDCQAWANLLEHSDDGSYYSQFVDAVRWHDQYRGLDFKKTFPEMARFI